MRKLGNPGGTPAANDEEREPACPCHRTTIGRLAALTAESLEDVASAARTGDVVAARRVLHGSRRRRVARKEAELAVRRLLTQQPPRPGALRHTVGELQLIAELGRVGDLVDTFARRLAAGRMPSPVRDGFADDLETLGGAGGRRLRHLADLSGPAMDSDYVQAGAALRASLHRLAGPGYARRSRAGADTAAASACSCLIQAVLSASSCAGRIA